MKLLRRLIEEKKYDDEIKSIKKQMEKQTKEIINNMPKLYENFTNDEKLVIDTFINKAKKICKGRKIVYDLRQNDINLMIDRMQIGRLALRTKRRKMQVLTKNQVFWYDINEVEEALNHIEEWVDYLKYLVNI